jgi:hypothetical protein
MTAFLFTKRYWKQFVKKTDSWIVILFLILYFSMFLVNSGNYTRAEGGEVSIFAFLPIFSMNIDFPLMTLAGFLMLISDIPVMNQGVQFEMIRTNRHSWFAGQVLYGLCVSVTYTLAIALLPCLFFLGTLSLQKGWGESVLDGTAFMADYVMVGYDAVLDQSAIGAWIKIFILFVGLEMLFVMICCVSNLLGGKGMGVAICSVFVLMERVLKMFELDLGFASPVVMLNRFYKDDGSNMIPAVCYFVLFVLALVIVGWRIMYYVDINVESRK